MTRRLVLVRHAKSDYPWGVDDHERPLNDRGRRDAPEIGRWLDAHLRWEGRPAPHVWVSSAKRAQQTWALASNVLSTRWDSRHQRSEPRIYEASASALIGLVDEAATAVGTLILVGHNPGLVSFIARVCTQDEVSLAATAKFATSAIAVLEGDGDWPMATAERGSFRVTAFAVPRGRGPEAEGSRASG